MLTTPTYARTEADDTAISSVAWGAAGSTNRDKICEWSSTLDVMKSATTRKTGTGDDKPMTRTRFEARHRCRKLR